MAGRTFGEEFGGKAIMWGPALAGAALLGPVGILVGLAASAAIVASGGSSPPSSADPPKDSTGDTADRG